jgi:hypothetical protein
MPSRGGDGSQLGQRVRPVLGDHHFVAKRRRARGSRWGDSTLRPSGAAGAHDLVGEARMEVGFAHEQRRGLADPVGRLP